MKSVPFSLNKMNNTTNLIIDIFILILVSIGILTSVALLSLIFYHRYQRPINIPTFLICNTYLAIIFTCLGLINMYAYNLYGDLYHDGSFDNWWCYGCAYLTHVGLCSNYLSYLLQACFRLFRVALFKYKQLQTFRFISRLVLIQWLASFLLVMPLLLAQYFEYIPQDYHCQVPFTNLRGTLFVSSVVYLGPILITATIYSYIVYFIKHTTTLTAQQNRRRSNQRDLIVLRRIVILVGMIFILSFPITILWMNYLITNYLNPIIYHVEWLIFSVSCSILPTASAFLSPQLRELLSITWRRNRRIQPVVVIQPQELFQTN
jgi:hypothetical protein